MVNAVTPTLQCQFCSEPRSDVTTSMHHSRIHLKLYSFTILEWRANVVTLLPDSCQKWHHGTSTTPISPTVLLLLCCAKRHSAAPAKRMLDINKTVNLITNKTLCVVILQCFQHQTCGCCVPMCVCMHVCMHTKSQIYSESWTFRAWANVLSAQVCMEGSTCGSPAPYNNCKNKLLKLDLMGVLLFKKNFQPNMLHLDYCKEKLNTLLLFT